MSFTAADLKDIKWSLLACCMSVGVAIGLISYSAEIQYQSLKELQNSQRQLSAARDLLVTAQNDLENMSSYQMEYDALVAQKVIGNEQRLDWIEGLENLRKQNLLPAFKYTISPQASYAPNPPLAAGNFALSLSTMTLELDLLHEAQLLKFFNQMSQQLPGWFLLESCSLFPSGKEVGGIRLTAECTGGWFTMKNRNTP